MQAGTLKGYCYDVPEAGVVLQTPSLLRLLPQRPCRPLSQTSEHDLVSPVFLVAGQGLCCEDSDMFCASDFRLILGYPYCLLSGRHHSLVTLVNLFTHESNHLEDTAACLVSCIKS